MRTAIIILLFASSAFGQSQSVVRVELYDQTEKLIQYGSGVVVADLGPSQSHVGWYDNHVVTCSHVVGVPAQNIQIVYRTGQKVRFAKIVADDKENDVAILRAIGPEKSKAVAVLGVFEAGKAYRYDGWSTRGNCRAALTNYGKAYFDGICEVGDSGGAVVDDNGRLVGIMQGGWFWLEDSKKTWPIRAASRGLIEATLRKVPR
jgi:hypothetical protein